MEFSDEGISMQVTDTNKRIAKNAFFLYIRLALILAVNLFTVKIVLKALGTEDYGIYSVVGGVVSMFAFLIGTMTSASQRFFSFELGRQDQEGLNRYFNMTLITYSGVVLIFLILIETVGLWFLKTQLVIPEARMSAAHWVYQLTVLSFLVNLMVIPYNSMIIAHEKMNVYAYVSVVESVLRLLMVYLLVMVSADKLKLYAVLMCLVTLFTSSFYIIYCRYHYRASRIRLFWNKQQFKEIMSYSGWNFFGTISAVLRNQGVNILLNIFFGPIVNAARAIAYQVNGAITQFVTSFFMAVQPQITKQYAAGDRQGMMTLVFRSSKFSYYLILLLAVPLLVETPFLLSVWLNDYPDYTVIFTQLIVLIALLESLSSPLLTAVQATGKISLYQVVTGGLLLLNLPVSYIFLKLGYSPESTMYVTLVIAFCSQISRMAFVKCLLHMRIRDYMIKIAVPITVVSLGVFIPTYLVHLALEAGWVRLGLVLATDLLTCALFVYVIGITKGERVVSNQVLRNWINKWNPWKKK